MPRLTEEEITNVIKEGQSARAQKARALATAVRERGFIIDDDIRQVSLLRGQFTTFMNSVLTPAAVATAAPAPKPLPLWLAALSACSVSALLTLTLLTAAAVGKWL
ncbi:hypothetical protein [Devosia neptuniae]|uniref:hypothetical protein n=1 Tax=Devosia neptuniae TaxID=191302 RepID=UPI0022B07729|nr:hypothetical protein [Devosia neptuniae]MCZ4347987.1 hypothetical protein [Devosia neptuniae]|tara:strand:+ start:13949 stop:14266 length:318 start_codon:yes stop_codon:yes gene_type:complete